MSDDKYIEYISNRSENTSIKLYLEKIRPHLGNMIDKLKKLGKWTIQSTMKVKFVSSKDNDDKQSMHSKSNNTEIMIDNETD